MALIKKMKIKKEEKIPDLDAITKLLGQFKGDKGDVGNDGVDGKTPTSQEVAKALENNKTFLDRLKGDKGYDGRDGNDGNDGFDGEDGKDGKDGKDGRDGRDARDGVDGKDGSPDSVEDIIKKIKNKLGVDDIKGLEEVLSRRMPSQMVGAPRIPVYSNGVLQPSPLGSLNITGGTLTANPGTQDYTITVTGGTGGGHVIKDEGVALTQRTNLNFVGAGVTVTDDVGNDASVVTIASTGGLAQITISGTIDDSNVTFTASSLPDILVINGGLYRSTGGAITWSYVAGTITLSSPVGTGGSIFGLTTVALGGSSVNFADNEVPSGVQNGVNTTFTLANTPTSGTLHLYYNGIRQKITDDFTLTGNTITTTSPPASLDTLLADYKY